MNEILIDKEIGRWSITAIDVINQLKEMNGDITVKISCLGGNVFEGIAIHNALKEYNKGLVHVVITSVAASIASYIAMAGDTITVYSNSTFMIHNAWLPTVGDHNKLRKAADIGEGLSSILRKRYAEVSNQPADVIEKKMDDETFYFGEEILTNGFCSEIISSESNTEKNEAIALAKEGFTACCKNVMDNFNDDEFVQSAAKLTKDGFFAKEQDTDTAEHENRVRELELINKGMKL